MLADVGRCGRCGRCATIRNNLLLSLASPGAPSRHADHNVDPLPRRPMTPGAPPSNASLITRRQGIP